MQYQVSTINNLESKIRSLDLEQMEFPEGTLLVGLFKTDLIISHFCLPVYYPEGQLCPCQWLNHNGLYIR